MQRDLRCWHAFVKHQANKQSICADCPHCTCCDLVCPGGLQLNDLKLVWYTTGRAAHEMVWSELLLLFCYNLSFLLISRVVGKIKNSILKSWNAGALFLCDWAICSSVSCGHWVILLHKSKWNIQSLSSIINAYLWGFLGDEEFLLEWKPNSNCENKVHLPIPVFTEILFFAISVSLLACVILFFSNSIYFIRAI